MLSPRILALALALATPTAALLHGLAGCRRTTHHLAVSRRARRPLLALVPSSGGGEQQELLERCFAASCPEAASAEPGDASPASSLEVASTSSWWHNSFNPTACHESKQSHSGDWARGN